MALTDEMLAKAKSFISAVLSQGRIEPEEHRRFAAAVEAVSQRLPEHIVAYLRNIIDHALAVEKLSATTGAADADEQNAARDTHAEHVAWLQQNYERLGGR